MPIIEKKTMTNRKKLFNYLQINSFYEKKVFEHIITRIGTDWVIELSIVEIIFENLDDLMVEDILSKLEKIK
jgi:hypothetical protein